jgi:hypothetical protein
MHEMPLPEQTLNALVQSLKESFATTCIHLMEQTMVTEIRLTTRCFTTNGQPPKSLCLHDFAIEALG